jgi:CMP/dCMP kinase
LKAKGQDVTLQDLIGKITQRDARDRQRVVAPLQPAENAIIIDTTDSSIDEVFDQVMLKVGPVTDKIVS